MKKINSIGYGGKVIGVGIVLSAIIPLTLKLVSCFAQKSVFPMLGKISFGCGAAALIGFSMLSVMELHQDKSKAAAVKDPKEVEIISKVSTAGIITDGGSISTLGILVQTILIDSEI